VLEVFLEDGLFFSAFKFWFAKSWVCVFQKRLYKINTNSLRQPYWLKACCLEKLGTYHIRGGNFSDSCLVTFSCKQSCRDKVPWNILYEFLKGLLADFLLEWMNLNGVFQLKISIIKSYYPLDKHPGPFWLVRYAGSSPTTDWRDNFTVVPHYASDGENSIRDQVADREIKYGSRNLLYPHYLCMHIWPE